MNVLRTQAELSIVQKNHKKEFEKIWNEQKKIFKLAELEAKSTQVDEAYDNIKQANRKESMNFVKWIKINRAMNSKGVL